MAIVLQPQIYDVTSPYVLQSACDYSCCIFVEGLLKVKVTGTYAVKVVSQRLVVWSSGRASVFGRCPFAVLRSTCSWWVTTYVGKPSTVSQPTRPTQPFILSGSINEQWAAVGCLLPQLLWWRHLVNATKERQAWCCLQVKLCDPRLSALSVVATIKALYKYTCFLFPFYYVGHGAR